MQKSKVVYFYPNWSPFVQKDIDFLSQHYLLRTHEFKVLKKSELPLNFLSQLIFLLKERKNTRIVICRFGGYHNLIPIWLSKILKWKIVLIFGGVECHCFPEINYGFYLNPVLRRIIKYSTNNADKILVVHRSLYDCDYQYFTTRSAQGLKKLYGVSSEKTEELKNGYDSTVFCNRKLDRKPKSFITAVGEINQQTYYLKGIDLIMEVARTISTIEVTIVGNLALKNFTPPKNVRLHPKCNQNELANLYNRHQFYLQLSMAEGFPNALCEAMLCGCVPIGSAVFGIPEIIDETGFILKKKNLDELLKIIRYCEKTDWDEQSIKAEARIRNTFDLKNRNNQFLTFLKTIEKS